MPGHYSGPPKPPRPKPPRPKPPAPKPQSAGRKHRNGASNGAKPININSGNTESGSVNADERYNPWGKGSKKNPTTSSQTTGP